MHRSRQEGFAVGAFNIDNQETLQAISQAAQKLQAPVMVEVSAGEVKTMGGCQNIRDMVSNYRNTYNIEMYINLDHAPTVELCQQAIDAGFEFIHID
ncbi:class II fructose-bisphosphate aldolase, partial [TM7 phylum sp. oral taxon 349]